MRGPIENVHLVYGLDQSQLKSGLICNHFVQSMLMVDSFFRELLTECLLAYPNFFNSFNL